MAHYMSFALTKEQICAGTKDVTRRLGWVRLNAGDVIIPVARRMGIKKGGKIQVLCDPRRVKSVRREKLRALTDDLDYGFSECQREGFGNHAAYRWPSEFVLFFCSTHKGCTPETVITRIEFEGL